jgi:branched-subunit amino acid transport protein
LIVAFIFGDKLLTFTIIVLDFILQKKYKLPFGLISSYFAVLSILVIINKSKTLYKKNREIIIT